MSENLEICETFTSLQGESSFAGLGCFFIRLSGCNLRCLYCDSGYAVSESGRLVSIDELVREARRSTVPLIEVTGGEPLVQSGTGTLLRALSDIPGKTVLVETNGSLDMSVIPAGVVAIVDVKCPDSGAADSFDLGNLGRLRSQDELKFVISSRHDYEWARQFVRAYEEVRKVAAVHFSPVTALINASALAGWIIEDGLSVRLQMQLHRLLEMR